MTTNHPFGPAGPHHDISKRHREQADMVKRALGPTYELQQRFKALQGPLANLPSLQDTGILATLAKLRSTGALHSLTNFHADRIKALEKIATPAWMLALQKTGVGLNRHDLGVLKTQKRLAASVGSDVLKLARTFDANRSTMATLMAASDWTEQFRTLSDRIAPSLAGIKFATERAQMLDMMTLRASADALTKSTVLVAAKQVLEAHRLIEAIGQTEGPEQSVSLLAALVSLMAALFSGFGENTMKELRGIGAIKLIEVFMIGLAILQFAAPTDMSPAEKKVFAEMQAEVVVLTEKLDRMLALNEAANEAYVSDLPRAELKRSAAIRRDPQGKAPVLIRGNRGMMLAVKESRGQWRLVVYRDPLVDQLSEGWVYGPVVLLLD